MACRHGSVEYRIRRMPFLVLARSLDQDRNLIRCQILLAIAAVRGIGLAANSLLFVEVRDLEDDRPNVRSFSLPLYRNREHITDAALRLNEARSGWIAFELASQAQNLHIDTAIEHVLVHARRLQQVLAT
jgi:hypothetical protein